jgi:AcrR family transcriptional regulator
MSGLKKPRGRPPTFNKEEALAKAAALFWRHGYEGTSIAMLVDAIGVAPPTLYSAFGSKDELFCQVLERYQRADMHGGSEAVPDAVPFRHILEHFLRASVGRFTDPQGPKGCMVLVGAVQHGPEGDIAGEAIATARTETLTRLVQALEGARAKREIPPETDCEALARFYMGVLQGMAIQAIDGADRRVLARMVDVAMRAWPAMDSQSEK